MSRWAVGLSASSCYPQKTAYTFAMAERLGYDGVEVMVWGEKLSRDVPRLQRLAEDHGQPILSVHAPTLFFLQHVWGTTWDQIDRSIELAEDLACPTVVAHPPFAWQRAYGRAFVEGIAERQARTEVQIAVENMYPWRVPGIGARGKVPMYLPGWDPTFHDYQHVTLDLSHSATAHADALAMARAAGPSLAHIHLADGSGSLKDEHLVPGEGTQPCAEVLGLLGEIGFRGSIVVEVGTRGVDEATRVERLTRSLAFAREHAG
ncbi:sugar phosphate isomerase/epimerase family protein [Kytococcus sedentarius]|uniref:sugar phosphate isomerase/epimerase family protein n=1 Tax=Kytococcus sedentarius TaxID=1276 RepID=UPI0035BC0C3B